MNTEAHQTNKVERIAVLTVHGVGEQKRFEHLEDIAANLCKALRRDGSRNPTIQVRHGDQVPRLSAEHSWKEAPVYVRWRKPDGSWIEVEFREVHWADLDMAPSVSRWYKLVFWSLGVAGVRLFDLPKVGGPKKHGMCPPKSLSFLGRLWVRVQLTLVSLMFLMVLFTLTVVNGILRRLSIRIAPLEQAKGLIFNYLGDVKLYQDWFQREDDRVETVGHKSRVAIRRRMIRALVALGTEQGISRYYVFAHSLGTVLAFNGLMESAFALPNYLTEKEWDQLPDTFKAREAKAFNTDQMPPRRPWLDTPSARLHPEKKLPRDLIKREELFAKLGGFLTMGSPLDKFAALWPAIVPVNGEPLTKEQGKTVPWYNIADIQDIVAGKLDLFEPCGKVPGIGGLKLKNISWAGERSLFTAHTSYWSAGKGNNNRLINRIIPWLEGGVLNDPDHRLSPLLAHIVFWGSLIILGVILLLLLAFLVSLFLDNNVSIPSIMVILAGAGLMVVLVAAISRGVWERVKFGRREK